VGVALRAQARVEHHGQARPPAVRHAHDVAGLELLEGGRGRGPALHGALLRQLGLAPLEVAAQPGVLLRVAQVAGHRLAVALERLEVARHLAGQPHHRRVGLELRERALQQRPRRLAADRPTRLTAML
jgi:hypothetical protein